VDTPDAVLVLGNSGGSMAQAVPGQPVLLAVAICVQQTSCHCHGLRCALQCDHLWPGPRGNAAREITHNGITLRLAPGRHFRQARLGACCGRSLYDQYDLSADGFPGDLMRPNKALESLLFLGIGLWRFGREEL